MRTILMLLLLAGTAGAVDFRERMPCEILDAEGNIVIEDNCRVLITSFDGGLAKVTYSGVIAPPADGEPRYYDYASTGYNCGAGRAITLDWYETISARGRVKFVCMLKQGE